MSRRGLLLLEIALVALALAACTSRETAWQRITRLRNGYRVEPTGIHSVRTAGGIPELRVDLIVVDTGRERLPWLTVLVHVQGSDGRDRLARRATVDVAGLVPGVRELRTAVVPGVGVDRGENVIIELEGAPPRGVLAELPEYAGTGESAP